MYKKTKMIFSDKKGFTLLEVLVSLLIVTLIAMMTLSIFTNSSLWILNAYNKNLSSRYAGVVLEHIRLNSYNLKEGYISETELGLKAKNGGFGVDQTFFNQELDEMSINVYVENHHEMTNLFIVNIEVTCKKQKVKLFELVSIVGKK
ncbi:hypothetical protein SYNTR_0344 [Candidatus Syntrophocurvum alkaliphilum]|uniref:Prepilin-type N-terminal cleavage/methylation domain-containing protein n=1 Tax=Candidatus Syntrophocurvum alkaliphilum TaxID=2293317 RepID=A0A6I6D8V0_9FIRM|nr:type II secretion system protein [Candidatus Syntrophocurvum alkaliphilum]QGT98937.1 hypothetical protein SYNTR_0344 [Candidatus Syntrophocurvum alkaliphilum]